MDECHSVHAPGADNRARQRALLLILVAMENTIGALQKPSVVLVTTACVLKCVMKWSTMVSAASVTHAPPSLPLCDFHALIAHMPYSSTHAQSHFI